MSHVCTNCVFGCIYPKAKLGKILYHPFPIDPELHKEWVAAVEQEGWEPKENSLVCQEHFFGSSEELDPYMPPMLSLPGHVEKFKKLGCPAVARMLTKSFLKDSFLTRFMVHLSRFSAIYNLYVKPASQLKYTGSARYQLALVKMGKALKLNPVAVEHLVPVVLCWYKQQLSRALSPGLRRSLPARAAARRLPACLVRVERRLQALPLVAQTYFLVQHDELIEELEAHDRRGEYEVLARKLDVRVELLQQAWRRLVALVRLKLQWLVSRPPRPPPAAALSAAELRATSGPPGGRTRRTVDYGACADGEGPSLQQRLPGPPEWSPSQLPLHYEDETSVDLNKVYPCIDTGHDIHTDVPRNNECQQMKRNIDELQTLSRHAPSQSLDEQVDIHKDTLPNVQSNKNNINKGQKEIGASNTKQTLIVKPLDKLLCEDRIEKLRKLTRDQISLFMCPEDVVNINDSGESDVQLETLFIGESDSDEDSREVVRQKIFIGNPSMDLIEYATLSSKEQELSELPQCIKDLQSIDPSKVTTTLFFESDEEENELTIDETKVENLPCDVDIEDISNKANTSDIKMDIDPVINESYSVNVKETKPYELGNKVNIRVNESKIDTIQRYDTASENASYNLVCKNEISVSEEDNSSTEKSDNESSMNTIDEKLLMAASVPLRRLLACDLPGYKPKLANNEPKALGKAQAGLKEGKVGSIRLSEGLFKAKALCRPLSVVLPRMSLQDIMSVFQDWWTLADKTRDNTWFLHRPDLTVSRRGQRRPVALVAARPRAPPPPAHGPTPPRATAAESTAAAVSQKTHALRPGSRRASSRDVTIPSTFRRQPKAAYEVCGQTNTCEFCASAAAAGGGGLASLARLAADQRALVATLNQIKQGVDITSKFTFDEHMAEEARLRSCRPRNVKKLNNIKRKTPKTTPEKSATDSAKNKDTSYDEWLRQKNEFKKYFTLKSYEKSKDKMINVNQPGTSDTSTDKNLEGKECQSGDTQSNGDTNKVMVVECPSANTVPTLVMKQSNIFNNEFRMNMTRNLATLNGSPVPQSAPLTTTNVQLHSQLVDNSPLTAVPLADASTMTVPTLHPSNHLTVNSSLKKIPRAASLNIFTGATTLTGPSIRTVPPTLTIPNMSAGNVLSVPTTLPSTLLGTSNDVIDLTDDVDRNASTWTLLNKSNPVPLSTKFVDQPSNSKLQLTVINVPVRQMSSQSVVHVPIKVMATPIASFTAGQQTPSASSVSELVKQTSPTNAQLQFKMINTSSCVNVNTTQSNVLLTNTCVKASNSAVNVSVKQTTSNSANMHFKAITSSTLKPSQSNVPVPIRLFTTRPSKLVDNLPKAAVSASVKQAIPANINVQPIKMTPRGETLPLVRLIPKSPGVKATNLAVKHASSTIVNVRIKPKASTSNVITSQSNYQVPVKLLPRNAPVKAHSSNVPIPVKLMIAPSNNGNTKAIVTQFLPLRPQSNLKTVISPTTINDVDQNKAE